jgi:hypothetical protein
MVKNAESIAETENATLPEESIIEKATLPESIIEHPNATVPLPVENATLPESIVKLHSSEKHRSEHHSALVSSAVSCSTHSMWTLKWKYQWRQ